MTSACGPAEGWRGGLECNRASAGWGGDWLTCLVGACDRHLMRELGRSGWRNAKTSNEMPAIGQRFGSPLVTPGECEELFNRPLIVGSDEQNSADERRFYTLGRSDSGRLIFVLSTICGCLIGMFQPAT